MLIINNLHYFNQIPNIKWNVKSGLITLFLLFTTNNAYSFSFTEDTPYEKYDNCLLDKLKSAHTNTAVRLVKKSCYRKYHPIPNARKLNDKELQKIRARASVTYFGFNGEILNDNTEIDITEVIFRVTITGKNGFKTTNLYKINSHIKPLENTKFNNKLKNLDRIPNKPTPKTEGINFPELDIEFSFSIESARGFNT